MTVKTWSLYRSSTRLLITASGSRTMRRLQGFFVCPKIFMGSMALSVAMLSIAPLMEKKKAFIVTDKAIKNLVEKVLPQFNLFGFEVYVCDKALPEPPIKVVEEIAEDMRKFEPDLIVAVGGGSAIDSAKGAWIKYEKPELEIGTPVPLTPLGLRKKALLMAIPTTAGTGSEATAALVLTDTEVDPPRKIAHMHQELVPDFAILIPELTMEMPRDLTIGTGLDALAHAFEAYINRNWANPMTDSLSIGAMKTIFKYLPRVVEEPRNLEARFNIQIAATMAGLAFSNGAVGLTHALGHAVGKVYGIHHGKAVGMMIPYVLNFVAKVNDSYIDLAKEFEIKENYLENLTRFFKNFIESFGVSTILKDYVSEDRFRQTLEVVARYAVEDPTAAQSIRQVGVEDAKKLLECVFSGKMPDW
ncbi:MAG: iron-containing alcohol dehydrogenase [Archaeoglobaceae archaeon]|nr:iron-containing alcohol dehydrogenase [Archaeoglobaceae archaeon]MCX8152653.1 iron-containing alcohol dehydrogenase [Archaeoglobaceae archaeon]MDW8014065.1 iron-containing alcohol dehydrogenase [Archaeoglobaceae archaeon]